MKKIPTLFARTFEGKRVVGITDEITPGCEEAFLEGIATVKIDGACCAIIDGVFYKRYDAKKGKKPPEGTIPCCDPDPVTGHWPHWVRVDANNPSDKWFVEAYRNLYQHYRKLGTVVHIDGTYEAIGPHFNGNPYNVDYDILVLHGVRIANVARDFNSVKDYLTANNDEGLVFWFDGEPICKIKRTDFGLKWPVK